MTHHVLLLISFCLSLELQVTIKISFRENNMQEPSGAVDSGLNTVFQMYSPNDLSISPASHLPLPHAPCTIRVCSVLKAQMDSQDTWALVLVVALTSLDSGQVSFQISPSLPTQEKPSPPPATAGMTTPTCQPASILGPSPTHSSPNRGWSP